MAAVKAILALGLVLLVCSIPLAACDECTDVVKSARVATGLGIGFTTPSAMRKCLGSYPFRAQRDLPVIDTVISGLDTFYVYKQLAKDSPSPQLPSKVDVVAQLKAVRQQAVAGNIKTTFSFLQKIKSVVQSLNDGHTVFINYCMEQGSYLGLPVMGVVENGVQKVRILPLKDISSLLLPYAMKTIFNLDISKYAGMQVQSIDGMDAFQYVLGFAAKYTGVSRDLGTRLNIAFARPTGTSTIDFGLFGLRTRLPPKDFLTYKIWVAPGKLATVRVPYMTFFNASFTDKTSYWNRFCKSQPAGRDPSTTTTTSINDRVKVEVKEAASVFSEPDPNHDLSTISTPHMALQPQPLHVTRFPKLFAGKKTQSTASLVNINPKGYFPVYLLSDGTAVVVYNTFAGVPDVLNINTIIDQTNRAFQIASSKGKRILLDMSGNGGGYTLLAWFLMRALVGSKAMPLTSHSPMQFLGSNNAAKQTYTLYQAQSKKTQEYLTPNVTAPATFTPYHFKAFRKGAPGGYYSNNFVTGEDIKGMSLLGNNSPPGLGSTPLLVLTNGNCFSACAIFTHVMQKRFGLKVVTVGGLTNQSLSSGSSCLGFTEESLQKFTAPLRGKVKGLPQPFRMNVDLSFASAAMYVNSWIPCEYVFIPGNNRIYYDLASYNNIGLLWQKASAFFPKTGLV